MKTVDSARHLAVHCAPALRGPEIRWLSPARHRDLVGLRYMGYSVRWATDPDTLSSNRCRLWGAAHAIGLSVGYHGGSYPIVRIVDQGDDPCSSIPIDLRGTRMVAQALRPHRECHAARMPITQGHATGFQVQ